MDYALIITAQESNKYHALGDLAPFGESTLLEWKLSQCKECVEANKIYIVSPSERIKKIANSEKVNYIYRDETMNYRDILQYLPSVLDNKYFLFINVATPFFGPDHIQNVLKLSKKHRNIVSVEEFYDYIFYNHSRLNFNDSDYGDRARLEPIYKVNDACHWIQASYTSECNSLITSNPYLFVVDRYSSIKIVNSLDYNLANSYIFEYFKKRLNV
jgi:CMP-N-acetylneuraminic acid synthetase